MTMGDIAEVMKLFLPTGLEAKGITEHELRDELK